MITLLGGGIGAARFSTALATQMPDERMTCIANTGDDFWHYGLRICPDLDTTLYTHAEWSDTERGWGLKGETFTAMAQVQRLGERPWFSLGDRDLATHLLRTDWLRHGRTLTDVAERLARAMNVRQRVLPMTDSEIETRVLTPRGWLSYQEFIVLHDAQDTVTAVCYAGAESARPTKGVLDAIAQAEVVILAPSNPFASILPILGLPGVREALRDTSAPVLAITPIVSGIPITDPGEAKRARSRAALMASAGLSHRAASVAGLYQDIVNIFVLDEADAHEAAEIRALGMEVTVSPTLLHREPVGAPSIELLLRRCLGSRR